MRETTDGNTGEVTEHEPNQKPLAGPEAGIIYQVDIYLI